MKKTLKLLLTLTLSLALVLGLASVSWGETTTPPTTYPVTIGGVAVTSDNLVIDSSDTGVIAAGSATYTPAEGANPATLTLDSLALTYHTNHGISASEDLTIKLIGESTITSTNGNAIRADDNSVVIAGDGTLNAYSNHNGGTSGIYTRDLTIISGTVTATSIWQAGISCSNNLTITGGTVTATGGTYGIYTNGGSIKITGGTVTASGSSRGVYAYNSSIEIANSTVTAKITEGDATGIFAQEGNIKIDNSNVAVEDFTDSADSTIVTWGIHTYNGSIAISGSTVTVKECNLGVYAEKGSIDISGSTVTTENCGISAKESADSRITISNSTVTVTTNSSLAIQATDYITITGGTVTASAEKDAICAAGDITIGSGAQVSAEGEGGIRSSGGKITIQDGETVVDATATGTDSHGIFASDDVVISNGTVTAKGDKSGIWSISGDITISDGRVTAEGIDYGIRASRSITIGGEGNPAVAVNTGCKTGLKASEVNVLKYCAVEIDAAEKAVDCTTLTLGADSWYRWTTANGSVLEEAPCTYSGSPYLLLEPITFTVPSQQLDFGEVDWGNYTVPAAQSFTITNLLKETITLTVCPTAAFLVDGKGEDFTITVPAEGTATLSVQPKAGLSPEGYLESIYLQGSGTMQEVLAFFHVKQPPVFYPVLPPVEENAGLITSPDTFDGGIASAVVVTILAATGTAWLGKKKD